MSSYFVWGPHGWVEVDRNVCDDTLPVLRGRWRHPQPQHWNDVRKEALERDCYRCVTCNSDGSLNVHHRTYVRWGREEVEDVYVLCRECHKLLHGIEDRPVSLPGLDERRAA